VATRHSYVSTDDLREYLAGTSYASNWTSDGSIIARIVEASSRRVDNYVGMQSFGPVTATRYYDIGAGALRDTPQNSYNTTGSDNLGFTSALSNAIILDAWLLSATTVTSYKQTDRSESETLVEGYNQDYLLMPYNSTPKVEIKLNEDTAKSFHAGQQTLAIAGSWGYTNDTSAVKTTTGAITSTTVTSWGVNDASGLSPAQTILVDSEQMYITSISSNTLTTERGVNGTTAATHSAGANVYTYMYPELVAQVCLDLGKIIFRDRDLGTIQTIGSGEFGITRSDKEIMNTLHSLDAYKSLSNTSEVYF